MRSYTEHRTGKHSGPNYQGRRLGAVALTVTSLFGAAEGLNVFHGHGSDLPTDSNVQRIDTPRAGHEGAGKTVEPKTVTYVVRQDDNPGTIGEHFGKDEAAARKIAGEIVAEESEPNILQVGEQVSFDSALVRDPHVSQLHGSDSAPGH